MKFPHKNAILITLLIGTLLVSTPVGTSVYAEAPIVGHGAFTIDPPPEYSPPNLGPNIYYEQSVQLVSHVSVIWNSVVYPNGDIQQILTARGTVDIYDVTDPLNPVFIETRSTYTTLRFYDAGGDASIGTPGGFYRVDWESVENMEKLHHIYLVQGVHKRLAWVRNGVGGGKVTASSYKDKLATFYSDLNSTSKRAR
jgi:hypothetical protein